jgi:hypothetical protein
MEFRRAAEVTRIIAVDVSFAILVLLAVYVRHWAVIVLWAALLVPLPTTIVAPKLRGLALFSFLGWIVFGATFAVLGGQVIWTGFLVMAVVVANYLAYDWDKQPPAPSAPQEPAFKDPVFTAATGALIAGGVLVLLALADIIPSFWLGPACGASGFALAVFVLAIARWRLRP